MIKWSKCMIMKTFQNFQYMENYNANLYRSHTHQNKEYLVAWNNLEQEPEKSTIKIAVKSLSVSDNILAKLIQLSGEVIIKYLCNISNYIWRRGVWPNDQGS